MTLKDIVKGGDDNDYDMDTMLMSFEAELSVFRRNRILFPYNREHQTNLLTPLHVVCCQYISSPIETTIKSVSSFPPPKKNQGMDPLRHLPC